MFKTKVCYFMYHKYEMPEKIRTSRTGLAHWIYAVFQVRSLLKMYWRLPFYEHFEHVTATRRKMLLNIITFTYKNLSAIVCRKNQKDSMTLTITQQKLKGKNRECPFRIFYVLRRQFLFIFDILNFVLSWFEYIHTEFQFITWYTCISYLISFGVWVLICPWSSSSGLPPGIIYTFRSKQALLTSSCDTNLCNILTSRYESRTWDQ